MSFITRLNIIKILRSWMLGVRIIRIRIYLRVTLDDPNNNIRPSTYYIHNASFVRLKNLKVGYTLPDKVASKLKLKRTYIYLQGQNLFTITGYEGIDPEVGLQSYSSENRSLDMGWIVECIHYQEHLL